MGANGGFELPVATVRSDATDRARSVGPLDPTVRSAATDRARSVGRLDPTVRSDPPDPAHSDPQLDSDVVQLGERIASLAAHIHAATHRLLTMIAEFDRRAGWKVVGHASCAHWLSYRTGIDMGAAREKVRAARALETLPKTSEAMSNGELSFSKVRALTRVATQENEVQLLDFAKNQSTARVERVVRGWKRHNRLDEQELERQRHESRTFSVFPNDEGMYVVRGTLDPEVGAALMRAIEAATDELYQSESVDDRETKQPAQRRADAVGLLAERALATEVRPSRAERFQVVLHVEAETLSVDQEPGMSELEDGTRVSAETSRRLSCDAGLVVMKHGQRGEILDVGRKTRTIPPAIRRALKARDRGCAFPGCGGRFTEHHHIRHWADGGATKLGNLVSLCRRHHRAMHEGGCRMRLAASGRTEFRDPSGRMMEQVPRMIRN